MKIGEAVISLPFVVRWEILPSDRKMGKMANDKIIIQYDGFGVYPPEHVKEILEGKQRSLAGPMMPPQGLTLQEVIY